MKNKKLLSVVLASSFLFACDPKSESTPDQRDSSSSPLVVDTTSSSQDNSSSTPSSSTEVTTSNRESSSSSSSSAKAKKIDVDAFKVQLNNSVDEMALQDKIGLNISDGSASISGEYHVTDTPDVEDNENIDPTLIDDKAFNFSLEATDLDFSFDASGLTSDDESLRKQSLVCSGELETSTESTLDLIPSDLQEQLTSFALTSYYLDNMVYLDLDDSGIAKIINSYNNLLPDSLSSLKIEENFIKFPLPEEGMIIDPGQSINEFATTFKDSINEFLDQYSQVASMLTGVMNFTKDSNYIYMTVNLNARPTFIKTIPVIYSISALSALDRADPDYDKKAQQIADTTEKLNALVDEITINTALFEFAFNSDGFQYLDFDFDIELGSYSLSSEEHEKLDPNDNKNTLPYIKETSLQNIHLTLDARLEFVYDQDVDVLEPDTENNTYTDMSDFIDKIKDLISILFNPEEEGEGHN